MDVFGNSPAFRWVVRYESQKTPLKRENFEEIVKEINGLAQQIISKTPTITSQADQQLIHVFTEKLKQIQTVIQSPQLERDVEAVALATASFSRQISPHVLQILKSPHLIGFLGGEQKELNFFLREVQAVLKAPISKDDLIHIKKVLISCYKRAQDTESRGSLEEIGKLVSYHILRHSNRYQNLLNYKAGELNGQNGKAIAESLSKFVLEIAEFAKDPDVAINPKELFKIYQNIKQIRNEYLGLSHLFQPGLENLRSLPAIKRELQSHFQEQLQNLNLNNPQLFREIGKLKDAVREIYTPGHSDLEKYLKALDALYQPKVFEPSVDESILVSLLQKKYPQLKKSDFDSLQARSLTIASKLALEHLKEGEFPDLEKLQAQAIKFRMKKFLEPQLGDRSEQAAKLLVGLEKFSRSNTRLLFQATWEDYLKDYDARTKGQFSQHVAQLGVAYMGEHDFSLLNEAAQKTFLDNWDTALIAKPSDFAYQAEMLFQEVQVMLPELFKRYYAGGIAQIHQWILKNFPYIKQVYDQDLDIHRNMSSGTCFQSSLNRMEALRKTPNLKDQDVKLGSSSKDRFANAIAKLERWGVEQRKGAKKGLIAGSKKQFELSNLYKLKEVGRESLSSQGPSSLMVEKMVGWCTENGETLVMLLFKTPDHAMNIQIDEKRKIFRFMDDNFGLVSYPDLTTFKKSFIEYLRVVYPDAVDFWATSYK